MQSDTLDMDSTIAAAWPERWAKANDGRPGASKRRNKLRGYWRLHHAFETFKVANPNARCGNCDSFKPIPHNNKMHCEAESDFYGYQTVKVDGLCMKWSPSTFMKTKE